MAGVIVLTQRGQQALRASAPPGAELDFEMLEGISFLEGMTPDELQVEFTVDASRFRTVLRRLQEAGLIEVIPVEQIGPGGVFTEGRPTGPDSPLQMPGSFFGKSTPEFVEEEF